ncbi:MAG: thioredoxin domain-containing protein, partial [Candidatus Bathyarchaeota archaeon]|nr:thioredoxin domain-containing protein [Candidatus Bathyarchaeota archaeon]
MAGTKVAWFHWGKEAFREAQRLNRPILLDISAAWCHWCHVMDGTTYCDDEVARLIKRRYIPIRVDRDQRPDIDQRYNMGGWPTTALLTPDGEVLAGATYVP